LSTNGIGKATELAKNATITTVLNAFGELYPPYLWMITPPTITPIVGPVIQVNEKYTNTVYASIFSITYR